MLGLLVILVTASSGFVGRRTAAQDGDAAEPVLFRRDVQAVLSRAGCNSGVCHGNKNGKGGLKLSLRGEDHEFDHRVLTREQFGRRIDRAVPDASLLLQKATLQIGHEGGRRFRPDSPEYATLRRWMEQGARDEGPAGPRLLGIEVEPAVAYLAWPQRTVQLQVRARFDDGERDVTRLAVYESSRPSIRISLDGEVRADAPTEVAVLVRYLDRQASVRLAFLEDRPDFLWQAPPERNEIDRAVFDKLRRLRVNPSPLCDDVVFLRRAYHDLLGLLPTADEARRFVADERLDKRERLIDELLLRPEMAAHFARRWCDLLKVEERTLDRKGVQALHHWLQSSIAADVPWSELVRQLTSARGSTYLVPAANWYRAHRDPITRAEAAAQVFLGVRMQCAKCHNHPFDRWTQDDYYSWAAAFAPVQYKVLENNRRDRNDGHEFDGEQIVWFGGVEVVKDPRTGQPTKPRFLGGPTPTADEPADRIDALAAWLAGPDNRRFAEVFVNRIWRQLLGRGVVEPIDDFRDTNPPSNPELLDALREGFLADGGRLRPLLRRIMTSSVYQLDSRPNESNLRDENFSHPPVARLEAETLLDAFCQALAAPVRFNGYPAGTRAGQLAGVRAVSPRERPPTPAEKFLQLFGKPPRLLACDCERSDETTLTQTFSLTSGPLLHELLQRGENRLAGLSAALAEGSQTPEQAIDELFWTMLSRPASPDEESRLRRYWETSDDGRAALEDIAWALLNSQEFLLRN